MMTAGTMVRVSFWKCIAVIMGKCVQIRPFIMKYSRYFPYAVGGIAAFLLGSLVGQLLLNLVF